MRIQATCYWLNTRLCARAASVVNFLLTNCTSRFLTGRYDNQAKQGGCPATFRRHDRANSPAGAEVLERQGGLAGFRVAFLRGFERGGQKSYHPNCEHFLWSLQEERFFFRPGLRQWNASLAKSPSTAHCHLPPFPAAGVAFRALFQGGPCWTVRTDWASARRSNQALAAPSREDRWSSQRPATCSGWLYLRIFGLPEFHPPPPSAGFLILYSNIIVWLSFKNIFEKRTVSRLNFSFLQINELNLVYYSLLSL